MPEIVGVGVRRGDDCGGGVGGGDGKFATFEEEAWARVIPLVLLREAGEGDDASDWDRFRCTEAVAGVEVEGDVDAPLR